MPQIFQFKNISRIPWLGYAVSTKVFGDVRLRPNRGKFFKSIGIEEENLVDAQQVHGDHVAQVAEEDRGSTIPATDALLTKTPNTPLFIRIADCVPILLVDPQKKVVGLVHAGWRGTMQGIVRITVGQMENHFGTNPADLVAGIGPSIGPCCYEVDTPVIEAFRRFAYADKLFSKRRGGHAHLDLWKANSLQLIEAGVKEENIEVAGLCTFENPDLFFSERREGPVGRFGAIIWIKR